MVGGVGGRDVAQPNSKSKKGSTGLHELTRSKSNFFFFNMRNIISEAADFNEGCCMQQIDMYASLVLYILNHSKGEIRSPCIRRDDSAG